MGCGSSKVDTNIKLYNLLLSHTDSKRVDELQEVAKKLALQHSTLVNMPWRSSTFDLDEKSSPIYVQESHYPPVIIDISSLCIETHLDAISRSELVPSIKIQSFIHVMYNTIQNYKTYFANHYDPTRIKYVTFYTVDSSVTLPAGDMIDINTLNNLIAFVIIY